MGCGLTEGRAPGANPTLRASAPPRQGALGAGLAEPPAMDARSIEKVTGVAYLRANEDGTHKVGLYNKGRLIDELDMTAGERRRVGNIEVELGAPGVVSMRYIS